VAAVKLERLKEIIDDCGKAAVAFSGGVDSTLLLSVAREVLGDDVLAVTVVSPFMPGHEKKEASETAGLMGARHEIVEVDESDIEGFADNPPDRCYICKKFLVSRVISIAKDRGISCVMDASNADDAGDYRPGIRALRELGIRSPLMEVDLTKDEIRRMSKRRGLPGWDKPAMACLATRIPYGERITKERLRRIDEAEKYMRSLGYINCRVRSHGDLARIEVSPERIEKLLRPGQRGQVTEHLRDLGFRYVTVDLRGYRTGSMNEAIRGGGDESDASS
jgi:uncharacterized protein